MNFLFFFWEYVGWHYGKALSEFIEVWKNIIWFLYHFFSMPLLVRTLFSPYRRLEVHERHIGLEERMSNLVANTLMRLLGFVLRTFMLTLGAVVMIATACAGIAAFTLWFLAPITLLGLIIVGIYFFVIR